MFMEEIQLGNTPRTLIMNSTSSNLRSWAMPGALHTVVNQKEKITRLENVLGGQTENTRKANLN